MTLRESWYRVVDPDITAAIDGLLVSVFSVIVLAAAGALAGFIAWLACQFFIYLWSQIKK